MPTPHITRPRRLPLMLICAVLFSLFPAPWAAADWVETSSDGESFYVRGGVVHDDDYEGERGEAATCTNCFWRLNPVCRSFLVGSQGACPRLLARCPTGMRPVEVLRANAVSRPPDSSPLWRQTGYSCVGERGPASTGRIREELTGGWQAKVPALALQSWPPRQTLVRLPTTLEFTSASNLIVRRSVVDGLPVTLRAVAARSLSCTVSWCTKAKSRVAVFKRSGVTTIVARAVWRGSFDALGLTNIPITDAPIVQSKTLRISVRELRRRLV